MRLLHVLHEFHKSLHQNDTSERFFFSQGISPLDFLRVSCMLRLEFYLDKGTIKIFVMVILH